MQLPDKVIRFIGLFRLFRAIWRSKEKTQYYTLNHPLTGMVVISCLIAFDRDAWKANVYAAQYFVEKDRP